MANILDYLHWRGDLVLAQSAFNPVDGLILAWSASMPMKGSLPRTLGEAAAAANQADEDGKRFVSLLSGAARFRSMRVLNFGEKFSAAEQLQFAALTVLTGDGRAFVAFRGTDSTLVGWKEDFNMAFSDEVPAQREAVAWLERAAEATPLPIRVGGHSKGGNLAVYAAAKCKHQRRIEAVYNFDGPGQRPGLMGSPEYRAVEPRIETFLPESSIVGILMEQAERYHVVRSSAEGVMQHSPYSWQVGPQDFELLDSLDWKSLYADRTLADWLDGMSPKDRERLVDALYEIVEATGMRTVGEVSAHWQQSGWRMLNAFNDLDLRTRALVFLSLGRLLRAAARNLQVPEE